MSKNPVTLSWAEVLVMLLVVIGGTGIWTLAFRAGAASDAVQSPSSVTAGEDEVLLHARADVERLRTALLQEKVETTRQESVRAYLRGQHPGLGEKPPKDAPPVSADVRTAYDAAARAIVVSDRVTQVLSNELAKTETAFDARAWQLAQARANLTRADIKAKQHREREQWWTSRARGIAAVLALLLVSWLACRITGKPDVVDANRVIKFSAAILLVIVAYEAFGAAGLMAGAIVLILLVLITAETKK